MTREEIITGLKFTVVNCLLDPDKLETFTEPISFADKITIDACKGAIDLLEQEPKWIPVTEDVPPKGTYLNDRESELDMLEVFAVAKEAIEQKTGHWITENMFDSDVAYRCSECNELFWLECGTPKDNKYNFCHNCGAKMVEP